MTDYSKILKFNPYHDEKGRFASRGGATYVSTPNLKVVEAEKQKRIDEIKQRMKELYQSWSLLQYKDFFSHSDREWLQQNRNESMSLQVELRRLTGGREG